MASGGNKLTLRAQVLRCMVKYATIDPSQKRNIKIHYPCVIYFNSLPPKPFESRFKTTSTIDFAREYINRRVALVFATLQ